MFDLHTNIQCKHSKGGVGVVMPKFNPPKNSIVHVSNVHKI